MNRSEMDRINDYFNECRSSDFRVCFKMSQTLGAMSGAFVKSRSAAALESFVLGSKKLLNLYG